MKGMCVSYRLRCNENSHVPFHICVFNMDHFIVCTQEQGEGIRDKELASERRIVDYLHIISRVV
jgi:hypothetical protein